MIKCTQDLKGNWKVYKDKRYIGMILRNGPRYWHFKPKGRNSVPGASMSSAEKVILYIEKHENWINL